MVVETEKRSNKRYAVVNFERKGHRRLSIDLPIEYYRVNSSYGDWDRSHHPGEGGLLIYFPERMEVGQRLRMKLFFTSDSGLKTIELLGEVVWTDLCSEAGTTSYRSGVGVIDISLSDLERLKIFLRNLFP